MKRVKVNIDEITDFDLNLAKSEKAIASVNEIVKLSLTERTQQLNALNKKIQEGTANLFEEKVLAKLLEERMAERIRVIHKNLPAIEKELKKRTISQSSPVKSASPPTPSPKTRPVSSDNYPSELLNFIASQKPPTPPTAKPSDRPKSSVITPSSGIKKQSSRSIRDVVVGTLLLGILMLSFWYVVFSEEPQTTIMTFNQQAVGESPESGISKETLQEVQTQFDEAMQELRFGDFEYGKAQLLLLIQNHSTTSHAEDAYIAIADTYRQRRNYPDEALKYYQLFTEQYPESSRVGLVQLKMGFSYEDMGDTRSAEEMYRLVLKRHGEKSRLGQLANDRLQSLKK